MVTDISPLADKSLHLLASIETLAGEYDRLGAAGHVEACQIVDRAIQALHSLNDTAQAQLCQALNLPVDYSAPGDLGALLDSGSASARQIRALIGTQS